MLKRPCPKDSDEDLLEEQTKFLASRTRPSAFVDDRRKDTSKATSSQNEIKTNVDTTSMQLDLDQSDIAGTVLCDVVERYVTDKITEPVGSRKQAFPKTFAVSGKTRLSAKKSLFASLQLKEKKKNTSTEFAVVDETNNSIMVDGSGLGDTALAQQIHEENITQLTQMSLDEILAQKKELESSLSSNEKGRNLLEFIKSKRRRQSNEELVKEAPTATTPVMTTTELKSVSSVNVKPNYLHMDVVESHKLEWTKDLPLVTNSTSGFNARFDFDGNLIHRSEDIPTTDGLHHHAEEPEVPGYSIEDIFVYIRSTNISQKLLGLRTMSNILTKANSGVYDKYLEVYLIPTLLSSGLLILLRWSLDSSTQSCMESSLACFRSLIYIESDEASLHRAFSWPHGMYFPCLEYSSAEVKTTQLTDVELASRDVIQALLRMDIVPRIRYILDNFRISRETVICIFEILTRIVRNSPSSALEVVNDVSLMKLLMKHFLPCSWSGIESDSVYGVPLVHALRFVTVACSCGRQLSDTFVEKYSILNVLVCYLTIDANQTSTSLDLILESFRLWKVLISFGFGAQLYLDLFPCIMKLVFNFNHLSAINSSEFDLSFACSVISFLESVLYFLSSRYNNGIISWSNVVGLVELISNLLRRWLCELNDVDSLSDKTLQLISCALSFFSQSRACLLKEKKFEEDFCSKNLLPFWHSSACRSLLNSMKNFSWFKNDVRSGSTRDSSSLPSLSSVCFEGPLSPILDKCSPFHFFTSMFSCILTCRRINCDDTDKLLLDILNDTAVIESISNLSNSHNVPHWFSRYELHYNYYLVKLAFEKLNAIKNSLFFHGHSLFLLNQFMCGDESFCEDLFSSVVFNVEFLRDQVDLCGSLTNLKFVDHFHLASPAQPNNNQVLTSSDLLRLAMDHVPQLKAVYMKAFADNRAICTEDSFGISSGLRRVFLVPWIFLPLEIERKRSMNSSGDVSESVLSDVIRNLECLYLFSFLHLPLLRLDVRQVYFYLSSIFLLGNDLFLNHLIHSYLLAIFVDLFSGHCCDGINWEAASLPGISSFRDFHRELSKQFGAVSYGDHVFSLYILFPLQQQFNPNFRLSLWSENSHILISITISVEQVPIPLSKYLFPLETEPRVLSAYFQALMSGAVTTTSPFLYLVAVHHLHHFIFAESRLEGEGIDISDLRSQIKRTVTNKPNSVPHNHVINYVQPNSQAPFGFELNK